MENFNINDLIQQLQEAESQEAASADNRVNKIAEIDAAIKTISKVLHQLFEQKAQLEAEEERYQEELDLLNEKFFILNDIYSSKK